MDWAAAGSDIDWAAVEAAVRRLQGRIYRAAAAGNQQQVKNLQKLLVRSTSAKRLAVRRVTQQNAGRATPGIDGVVCRTPRAGRGWPLVWNGPAGQPVTGTPVVPPCAPHADGVPGGRGLSRMTSNCHVR